MKDMTFQLVREETFCFTPEGERAPIHIRSGKLREMLLAQAMDRVIKLTFPQQPLDMLVKIHGLEAPRLESMTLEEAMEPVIIGIMPDGSSILIDGGHRRWFWAAQGVSILRGWAVPYDVWSKFIFDPTSPSVLKYHDSGEQLPQRRKRNAEDI